MRKIKSITEGKTNHNVNTPPQMVHVILTKKNEIKKNAQLATCYSGKKKKKITQKFENKFSEKVA